MKVISFKETKEKPQLPLVTWDQVFVFLFLSHFRQQISSLTALNVTYRHTAHCTIPHYSMFPASRP